MDSRAEVFSGRLLRDERIVWSGRPRQGLILSSRDVFLVPFSLLWGGFAIFWEAAVLRAPNAPMIMPLFGAVFVIVGLYVIAGRFFFDAWLRTGVFYALTNRRILVLRSRPSTNVQAIALEHLPVVTLKEGANGRGTIRFGPDASFPNGRNFGGAWAPTLDPVPQFIAIPEVRAVFAAIQERTQPG